MNNVVVVVVVVGIIILFPSVAHHSIKWGEGALGGLGYHIKMICPMHGCTHAKIAGSKLVK